MQRWEYLRVLFEFTGGAYHARYVNGVELTNWKNQPTRDDYLGAMGNEGWELVSYIAQPSTYHHTYVWIKSDWKEVKGFDLNGNKHTYEGPSGLFEYLDVLGAQGFEVIAASPQTTGGLPNDYGSWCFVLKNTTSDYCAVFKRQRV